MVMRRSVAATERYRISNRIHRCCKIFRIPSMAIGMRNAIIARGGGMLDGDNRVEIFSVRMNIQIGNIPRLGINHEGAFFIISRINTNKPRNGNIKME